MKMHRSLLPQPSTRTFIITMADLIEALADKLPRDVKIMGAFLDHLSGQDPAQIALAIVLTSMDFTPEDNSPLVYQKSQTGQPEDATISPQSKRGG